MNALTYIPTALSAMALVAYMLSVAAFYRMIPLPHMMIMVFPALTWFMFSWGVGLVQLVYGAIRRRDHPFISGLLTLAAFGAFMLAIENGWIITV
ncbi:MAG: hypothetical protein AAFV53_24090 [Myxococcota bacterium]